MTTANRALEAAIRDHYLDSIDYASEAVVGVQKLVSRDGFVNEKTNIKIAVVGSQVSEGFQGVDFNELTAQVGVEVFTCPDDYDGDSADVLVGEIERLMGNVDELRLAVNEASECIHIYDCNLTGTDDSVENRTISNIRTYQIQFRFR